MLELVSLDKFDHINQLITLTEILLSGIINKIRYDLSSAAFIVHERLNQSKKNDLKKYKI